MATKISTIYADLRTELATLFPNHKEINNPNDLNDDAEIMYESAWGVYLSTFLNTSRFNTCTGTTNRNFVIKLIRNLRIADRDIEKRISTEKLLLEDEMTLFKYFDKNPNFSVSAITKVVGDDGLVYKDGDNYSYIELDITIAIEYFESL